MLILRFFYKFMLAVTVGFAAQSGSIRAQERAIEGALDCSGFDISTCPSRFENRCKSDAEFQKAHSVICLDVLIGRVKDDPACVRYEEMNCQMANEEAAGPPRDCSSIRDPFERAECEDDFPSCAKSAGALIDGSTLLIGQIQEELSKYGGLLELDLDNIGDKERLCGFSRNTLTKYYYDATGDSRSILDLELTASDIDACANKIQAWVQKRSAQLITTDDKLGDNLIRSTKEELKPLAPLRQDLGVSVRKLKEAGPKIYSLIVFHNRFCRAADARTE